MTRDGDSSSDSGVRGHLLLVDDEPEPRRALSRVLRHAGYEVETASDGQAAVASLLTGNFDGIVTDILMPGIGGIELLKLVQSHDPDLPVILMTGAPAVETAILALDHGAYKYMLKPIKPAELEEVVNRAVQLRQMSRIRKEAMTVSTAVADPKLQESFDQAFRTMWMAFQPILTAEGVLYGYEALMRSKAPGLPHPGAVLQAADRLGQMDVLGRQTRRLAAEPVTNDPSRGTLFVNLHPSDLEDEELVSSSSPLAKIASRVVLEITEREGVDSVNDLRNRVAQVRETGYRVAIDDLGAGYAGLTSFALLEPDIVKIDMSLVRDVDTSAVKQRLILSITRLCRDMGIEVVGEGVETAAERDMLVHLGCDLLQGYCFAKPSEPFPAFSW
ncbi:MAG: EAL domain-containing protein [Deltaproteobacteria bacterium]|nr:EAL domain-containing protein [Deltaproteobacteria bacterium]